MTVIDAVGHVVKYVLTSFKHCQGLEGFSLLRRLDLVSQESTSDGRSFRIVRDSISELLHKHHHINHIVHDCTRGHSYLDGVDVLNLVGRIGGLEQEGLEVHHGLRLLGGHGG